MREKIPVSFRLMGQLIKIKYEPAVNYKEDVAGWAKYRTNEIVLQPMSVHTPLPQDAAYHNFLHEFIHFIFYWAGEDQFDPPLHKREYLIDRIAGLLHQAIITMEFDYNETECCQRKIAEEKINCAQENELANKLKHGKC